MSETNILHVIDTLGIGGAEKVMVGTINSLPEFQHHVIYLSGDDTLAKQLPASCKISTLNFRSKLDIVSSVIKLHNYIREHNIQIVHTHLYMATLIARIACPKNVKLFTTIHSLPGKSVFARSKMALWLEKLTYRSYHHIIAICHEVYKDYDACIGIKGPSTILYNYVDDSYYRSEYKKMSFNGTFRMVAVGNLKEAKNYPYLLEAFKTMPKNIYLDIYGSGHLQEKLEKDIKKFNLNIKLCGSKSDIQNVLPQYDAFIMTSIYEGQPISLLEAMACGMPAILSDIPVLREVTENKAIFCDLEKVEDLVQKVTAIAKHEVDLDEYAKANFERVKKIASKENYMARLRKIYETADERQVETYKMPPVKILRPILPATAS
jgi:glycosyltransferase involved in cell wall biosynthesis